ncbi:16S rRNA (cytidine1402-2'-O)-methyltransferase [Kaistia soli DSM 19436]|uniref:Ribosomal RNA small subunit methyltransferase I n=1 Tax=Kaistia soli DSM 19436 TaxID=1122133 RepID=A0A1M5D2G3_9HYPH|nr:16S rRNA (cytidine(1402)-2'-O)-methyltransferase [Kaistia soli]SHF61229.1 16S rRNA (cytidine1402-2'-O)-methyltransferase [Kaistia soli DSM 19436]
MSAANDEPLRYTIDGQAFTAPPLPGGLYIVSTPIGNLRDITIRALQTLAAADIIACEDTRTTRVLLRHYGLSGQLIAYHEHNAAEQRPRILEALDTGRSLALVSDAGTPLISDPGYRLVADVTAAGHLVVPIPGASAILAGLVAAALPTDAFFFAGFLPTRTVGRKKRIAALAAIPGTLVFYESPHRTAETLADLAETLGPERPATMARELTKTFETHRRGTLGSLAAELADEPDPKGEIVIMVGPPEAGVAEPGDVDALLLRLLADHPVKEAAQQAAAQTGLPRRDLYQRALALKQGDGGDDDAA